LSKGGYSGGAVVSDSFNAVVAIQIRKTKEKIGAGSDTVVAMPLYRIAKFWEPLYTIGIESWLMPEDLRKLLGIIAQVGENFEKWFSFYQEVLPQGYKPVPTGSSLLQVVRELANIPFQPDSCSFPIVQFILELAKIIRNKKLVDQLIAWVDTVCPDNDQCNKENPHDYSNEPIHLLVHLIPDPNNRANAIQEFKIHIYAWRNAESCPKIYEENGCTQEDILGVIDQAIEEKINEEDELVDIEFILPLEWIHLDVASWTRKEVFGWETRLIEDYRLRIRLDRYHYGLNRKFPKWVRDRWKRNWTKFKKVINKECDLEKHINWLDSYEEFNAKCFCNEYLAPDNEKTFLAMTFFPEEASKIGEMILMGGIPVALWCNQLIHHSEEHLAVKEALCCNVFKGRKFNELLEMVHRVCRKEENEKRMEDHLALFWDNPERVPLAFGKSIDLE
jgi:hypothetical protein